MRLLRRWLTDRSTSRDVSVAAVAKGPPNRRRLFAGGGELPAIHGRTEFDPPRGWGLPKTLPRYEGQNVAGSAATQGLATRWHSRGS